MLLFFYHFLFRYSASWTFVFLRGVCFSHHILRGEKKDVYGAPRGPVYPLNPIVAYLGSGEELQKRIGAFWSPPVRTHDWGTTRGDHSHPRGGTLSRLTPVYTVRCVIPTCLRQTHQPHRSCHLSWVVCNGHISDSHAGQFPSVCCPIRTRSSCFVL